jgi:hypothetical protein
MADAEEQAAAEAQARAEAVVRAAAESERAAAEKAAAEAKVVIFVRRARQHNYLDLSLKFGAFEKQSKISVRQCLYLHFPIIQQGTSLA